MEKSFFNNQNKKYILLFPIAIIVGTIFANLCGVQRVKMWDIFSLEYISKYNSITISFNKLLGYIFQKRMRILLLILLSCYTSIKDKIALVVCAGYGFSTGIVIAALTMQYGFKYFPVFVCAVLCHMILYGMGIYIIFRIYISDRISHPIMKKKKYAVVTIGVIIYTIGIIVESFMNCVVLPNIFKLYF